MWVKFDEKGNKMVWLCICVFVVYGVDRWCYNFWLINIVFDDVSVIRVVSGVFLYLFFLISGFDDCVWFLYYLNLCIFLWLGV